MTGRALDLRLVRARAAGIDELVAAWKSTTITLRLAGMAAFADAPSIGNKLRGALGTVLLGSASQAVKERKPCTWRTACTAEVFFGRRPIVAVAGERNEVPKPFALWAEKTNDGALLVKCRIFGFARSRTSAVAGALVTAVGDRVFWDLLAQDVGASGLASTNPQDVREEDDAFLPGEPPEEAEIDFVSAFDAERGEMLTSPSLLAGRLVARVALVGLWHGIDTRSSASAMLSSEDCNWRIETEELVGRAFRAKGGQRFANRVNRPASFRIAGDLSAIWPVLKLGELAHVGRGTTVGLGRYRLSVPGDKGAATPIGNTN
ncbi:hypothetical protein MYXO_02786 [Myxococcaceae bacterium]|nr:hypothetical protein [Afipia sp.]CAG0997500.1 hypothetical protein MYXO_02786 [Myxococcaceae bacterium]